MKTKLKKLVPPGSDVKLTIKLFAACLIIMFLLSLIAPIRIGNAHYYLFYDFFGEYHDEGNMMPHFYETIQGCMRFFWVVIIFSISYGIINLLSFSKDTKSIYVMKRIPDAFEIYKRSFAIPLLTILAAIVLAIVLLAIYYLHYRYCPPEDRIYTVQFSEFLRAFI